MDKGYAHLNFEYATFLRDKIVFHHKHTEFEGDISLEKFLKHQKPDSFEIDKWYVAHHICCFLRMLLLGSTTNSFTTRWLVCLLTYFYSIEIVSQLLDLQESVFRMQGSIIRMREMNDCRAGALIPLVLESYAIYTMVTHFLTKMVDSKYPPPSNFVRQLPADPYLKLDCPWHAA